ncbi:GSCOCT00013096001.2-RA-CDS [Cotesia congregata]|uniref:Cc_bv9.8_32.11b_pseudo n=1 Tax=Cotesia congregata TaxID=51543 RepID=A0A8J2HDJ9_COTCN|nr:GSCOCT00013096001.2-RA-CDS [Cotesia congregata]CAG5092535.1 cc_bv9.8_32.11b_pseudo [Cotesia congregata]
MGFERIITCQPALAEWTEYQGVVEREAGESLDRPSTSLIIFPFMVNFSG